MRTDAGTDAGTDAWWDVAHHPDPADDPESTQPIALAGVPLTRTGRPARAARPSSSLPPARAVAGAAVAVAGVALGIGTLLWATEPPAGDPTVTSAAASAGELDEVAVPEPDAAPAAAEVPAQAVSPEPSAPPPPVAPPSAAPAAPVAPPAARPASADDLVRPLLVLNNSRIEGLAERAARQFEALGWPVRDTGGLRGRIRASTVYYEPGQEASARALAERTGIPRVLPRLDGLPGSGLTVVVTRDFVGR